MPTLNHSDILERDDAVFFMRLPSALDVHVTPVTVCGGVVALHHLIHQPQKA